MGLKHCEDCGTPVSHGHFVNNQRLCFSCKFKHDRAEEEARLKSEEPTELQRVKELINQAIEILNTME